MKGAKGGGDIPTKGGGGGGGHDRFCNLSHLLIAIGTFG